MDSAAVTCGPRGNRVPRLTPGAHAPGSWAASPVQGVRAVDRLTRDLLHCLLTDHLNTVRDIARYDSESDTTTVVNHLVYDAYGNVTSETNSAVDSLFLFTARPFDPDTGLQNNLNRWYDPSVGRWLSEDPIGYDAEDFNLYRYAANNPTNATDPRGLKLVHCGDIPAGLDKWIQVPDTWNGGDPCTVKLGFPWHVLSSTPDQTSVKWICASIGAKCKDCSPHCCEKAMAKFLNAVYDTWILNICGLPVGPNTCERWAFDLESRLPDFGLGDPCIKNAGIQTFRIQGGGLSPRHVTYKIELCDGSVVYADNGAWGGRDHIFLPGDIPNYATPE